MRRRLGAPALALLSALAAAGPAAAQSAADKATAREVATEGMKLFDAGKYQEALDRLRRAQELFNAPVHLLYIARSQEKLGQLVEASENYQLLVRYTLPGGAPEAWVSAVDDGKKELAALEPRIPKLRVLAEPAELTQPQLQIDGAPVSAAVIGIARPVNPGRHRVTLAAQGKRPATADVDVPEGKATDVKLTLMADLAAPQLRPAEVPPESGGRETIGFIGFMAGLRLGGVIPTGKLREGVNATDYVQGGGGLELHAGVRIARYFTPVLFVEGETLGSAGAGDAARPAGQPKAEQPTAGTFGFGVLIGTPPGQFGGFGEIDLALAHAVSADLPANGDCNVSYQGGGFRFGGGGVFPLTRWLHVTPFVMATLVRSSSVDATSACVAVGIRKGDIASANQTTHGLVFLGVGGDVVFGKDTSRK